MIKSLTLFIASLLVAVIALPFGFAYSHIKFTARSLRTRSNRLSAKVQKYWYELAFGIDQLGNIVCQDVFNDWFIKSSAKDRYNFGNPDQTVSHVTGVNEQRGNLTFWGRLLAGVLNAIDPNHTSKAAKNNQYNGGA